MKQVSNAYKLSMKSLLREQSFVEITFSQVDTAAATDGNWVSNGARGLKSVQKVPCCTSAESRPARGAWIEIRLP